MLNDDFPRWLRPLADEARERERAENERVRSALAKERAALHRELEAQAPKLHKAVTAAEGKFAEAQLVLERAKLALDEARAAYFTPGLVCEARTAAIEKELRERADDRIDEAIDELNVTLNRDRQREPEVGRQKTGQTFSGKGVYTITSNLQGIKKRVEMLLRARQEIEALKVQADVDVPGAIAKIRARIPEFTEAVPVLQNAIGPS